MGKALLLLLFSLLLTIETNAQYKIINCPRENAFLARNKTTGKAALTLLGTVSDSGITLLQILIYSNGKIKQSSIYYFNSSSKSFYYKTNLDAGKFIYKIEFLFSGKSNYSKTIDGIMVGDVYLVQGQSNAVAGNYYNSTKISSSYRDTFIKSFGSSSNNAGAMIGDTTWYKAEGDGFYGKGNVGQWALVMAKNILDSFGIPICLFNGAVGGTAIIYHVPNKNNHSDLNTIYGRLNYRVKKAGLEKSIKGILYFQGESDGSNAKLHDSLFRLVYKNWSIDFAGFEKLYVIQVRGKGCGAPSNQLLEYQRNFGKTLPNCSVISSNGLNNHDGCHYGFKNGYELLGQQLAAMASKDLYHSKRTSNVDPPNIKSCFYSNSTQDEITLEMEHPNDIVYADTLFQKLFKIEGDATATITKGFIRNNKVVLQLNKSSCLISGLTYESGIGTQPWVKNATKAGIISFYNVPIKKHRVVSIYEGCKNVDVVVGSDSIPGCKYLWKRISDKKTFTTAKLLVKANKIEQYTLILSYAVGVCKTKDTISVSVIPDQIVIPELGPDLLLCAKDSIDLSPDFNGFSSFEWKTNSNPVVSNPKLTIKTNSSVLLVAKSLKNCFYTDSLKVSYSEPKITLPHDLKVCQNNDTLITISDSFDSYKWNGNIGNFTYRAVKGLLVVEVINKSKCKAVDSIEIYEYKSFSKPFKPLSACKGEKIWVAKPNDFVMWTYSSKPLLDSIELSPGFSYPIVLTDSNKCDVWDTLKIIENALPEFSLGNDTGFCINSQYVVNLPLNMTHYIWNGKKLNTNQVNVNSGGTYIGSILNSNGCQFTDTFLLLEYSLPNLMMLNDTTLCKDSSWHPKWDNNDTYFVNKFRIDNTYKFQSKGTFEIMSTNSFGCSAQKSIQINTKDCVTGIRNTKRNFDELLNLYPNPFCATINIECGINTEANIYQVDGVLVSKLILKVGINEIDLSFLKNGIYILKSPLSQRTIIKN